MPDVMTRHDPEQGRRLDPVFTSDELRQHTVRGGAVTLIGQAMKFALSIVSLAILGRLLTPADFGLVAMVLTFTRLADLFKDLGLGLATVQRASITHEQVSTLYWLNIGIGVVLSVIVATIAPIIAWFFGEPRLLLITLGIAGTFIFAGATVQPQALLRRRMAFQTLTIVEVIAMSLGVAAAVISALSGAGVWALVLQLIINAFANAIGITIASRWRPTVTAPLAQVASMLRFGGHLSGSNLLTYIVRNSDNLLIGRLVGETALGYYTKAYQLLLLPIQQLNAPLNAVALPALSRCQDDPDRFRLIYRKGLEVLTAVGMPVVVVLAITADRSVVAVLGDQWRSAAVLFQLLAPAAFIGTFNVASAWIFIPLDRADRAWKWSLINAPITACAFAIGVRWQAEGVAIAFSFVVLLLRPFGLWYAIHGTPVRWSDLRAALARPMITALGAGVITLIVSRTLTDGIPETIAGSVDVRLIIDLLVFAGVYASSWLLPPGGRTTLRGWLDLRRDLRRPGTRSERRATS